MLSLWGQSKLTYRTSDRWAAAISVGMLDTRLSTIHHSLRQRGPLGKITSLMCERVVHQNLADPRNPTVAGLPV